MAILLAADALAGGHPALVGAFVLALEFGFVSQIGGETGVAVGILKRKRLDHEGIQLRVSFIEPFGAEGNGLSLVLADAAEAPFGVGHFPDVTALGVVLGIEVGGGFVEKGLELGWVVARQQHGLGAEAVAAGGPA